MYIDFSDMEEKEVKDYKPGVYEVQVVNAEEQTTKSSGKSCLMVEFETQGEEMFKIKHWFYFTPKAKSIFKNFMYAIGLCEENEKEGIKFDLDDLLGARLQVELVKDEEGKYLQLKPWSCKAINGLATPTKKADTEEEVPF